MNNTLETIGLYFIVYFIIGVLLMFVLHKTERKHQRLKKIINIVMGIILLLVLGVVVDLIVSLKGFQDKMPVIASKGPISAEIGDTVMINELADVEKSVETKILPDLERYPYEGNDDISAKVSDDGQSVFVGNEECEFDVTVYAFGENHEPKQEKITIRVYDKKNR